jgi:hypothetical protein
MRTPQIIMMPVGELRPNKRNARTHSKKQIRQIANSILRFGFTNPILIDEQKNVIAGHGRLLGAMELGLKDVPVIVTTGLTDAEKRALASDQHASSLRKTNMYLRDFSAPRSCARRSWVTSGDGGERGCGPVYCPITDMAGLTPGSTPALLAQTGSRGFPGRFF